MTIQRVLVSDGVEDGICTRCRCVLTGFILLNCIIVEDKNSTASTGKFLRGADFTHKLLNFKTEFLNHQ
jgi:hypothetical protein